MSKNSSLKEFISFANTLADKSEEVIMNYFRQHLNIETKMSRNNIAITIQSSTLPTKESKNKNDINAAETSILSAKGSKYIPNFVITLYLRAIYPSNQSVIEAKIKINKAYNSYPVNKE